VPETESPGEANTAEGSEEHESVSGETDRLYETVQKVIAAMPLLAISSVVLLAVFSIQAIRYHNLFATLLALWFLVLGSQSYIIFEIHRINMKWEEHCCDGKYSIVNMILWFILLDLFYALPVWFIQVEPILIGKIGVIGHFMNAITIALTVFLTFVLLLDEAYTIYEVMPIRVD